MPAQRVDGGGLCLFGGDRPQPEDLAAVLCNVAGSEYTGHPGPHLVDDEHTGRTGTPALRASPTFGRIPVAARKGCNPTVRLSFNTTPVTAGLPMTCEDSAKRRISIPAPAKCSATISEHVASMWRLSSRSPRSNTVTRNPSKCRQ